MPIIVGSSSFERRDPQDPSLIKPKRNRKTPGSLGPVDISPITETDVSSLDDFTFQLFDLKQVYGAGIHSIRVSGTTKNLLNRSKVRIGIQDSKGERINWNATPTKYGFNLSFYLDSSNHSNGPAILEIAGKKKSGETISLIERFDVDLLAPPRPFGVRVEKRGFHTVDVSWGYSVNKFRRYNNTDYGVYQERDLAGFHVWAQTSSQATSFHLTQSQPVGTYLCSDKLMKEETTASFAISVSGIDEPLILQDKTLYFYVTSFDDVGNEDFVGVDSDSIVFGAPGIPTSSNKNVFITIPERGSPQRDYSSFDDGQYVTGAFVYGTNQDLNEWGLSHGGDAEGDFTVFPELANVLHTSSAELNEVTNYITCAIASSSTDLAIEHAQDGGILLMTVNTRSSANVSVTLGAGAKSLTGLSRFYFTASGSASFMAGPTKSFAHAADPPDVHHSVAANPYSSQGAYSYPFPMIPIKPGTDYILSFWIKAVSDEFEENKGFFAPPLRIGITGSKFTSSFSMSGDVPPITHAINSDIGFNQGATSDGRLLIGAPAQRISFKFNSDKLGYGHTVLRSGSVGNPDLAEFPSSKAPNFDMANFFFFADTGGSECTGTLFGNVGDTAGQGGGWITSGTLTIPGITPEVFPGGQSGAGNSGSRFSGTWLGEELVLYSNARLGHGHLITGSHFFCMLEDQRKQFAVTRLIMTGLYGESGIPPGINSTDDGVESFDLPPGALYAEPGGEDFYRSGALLFSGSVLPTQKNIGITNDQHINHNFGSGTHLYLSGTNLFGDGLILDDGERSSIGKWVTQANPGHLHVTDTGCSGAFFYWTQPSASTRLNNNLMERKAFFFTHGNPHVFNHSTTIPEVEIRENDPCLVYFSSKDVFLSGSGFVSKSLQSSGIETQKPFQGIIKAVFIIPEDQRIKFYATTGDGLYPTHKAAQCMDFEVLSASHEPYSASGDVESKVISPGDPASHTNAVLRVKILRGVINQEFNDSARNYKVRLKVVTLGGFTGSIHVGNGYDPSGSTAGRGRYTIDPRAGETHDWELGGDPNIFTDIRDKTFTHSIESHVYVNYYFEGCIRGGPGES